LDYLRRFYFGPAADSGVPSATDIQTDVGLKPLLASKLDEIDPKQTSRYGLGSPGDGEFREEVFVRDGRFGPFIEQGDRKASSPLGLAPDELTLNVAMELLTSAAQGEQPLGTCPVSGKPIYVKNGRFGPYIQLGENDDDEKRNAGLLKGMTVDEVNLDVAIKLLSLPRDLGEHPQLNDSIIAMNGKFGPYIKCGSETRSLPANISPLDVTFQQAIELLAQPKTRGRGAAKKEPILSLAESPVTGKVVQVLDGRFGAYITDGATNATVPKDMDPSQITLELALDLLAARAALGPTKKKAPKKAAKKSAAPKKAASGKSATAGKKKPTKKSKTTKKSED
jgi:DNA topoisomerase-1